MRLAEHVATIGARRVAYRVLVGKPEGRRPLGRARIRWEGDIKTNIQNVGWEGMDWINLN
jgi:hypothetical protein